MVPVYVVTIETIQGDINVICLSKENYCCFQHFQAISGDIEKSFHIAYFSRSEHSAICSLLLVTCDRGHVTKHLH